VYFVLCIFHHNFSKVRYNLAMSMKCKFYCLEPWQVVSVRVGGCKHLSLDMHWAWPTEKQNSSVWQWAGHKLPAQGQAAPPPRRVWRLPPSGMKRGVLGPGCPQIKLLLQAHSDALQSLGHPATCHTMIGQHPVKCCLQGFPAGEKLLLSFNQLGNLRQVTSSQASVFWSLKWGR
jgi:hypothetical protein